MYHTFAFITLVSIRKLVQQCKADSPGLAADRIPQPLGCGGSFHHQFICFANTVFGQALRPLFRVFVWGIKNEQGNIGNGLLQFITHLLQLSLELDTTFFISE